MPMRIVKFYDPQLDKVCVLTLDKTKLITENINKGKSRITEKEFPSEKEALKQCEKKEWATLKKGFVMKNDNPKKGEAVFHYFVSTGYTGALTFDNTPEGIFVYKLGERDDSEIFDCFIVLLDTNANLKETIKLPQNLPWRIKYHKPSNNLWLDLSHDIYKYNLEDKKFTKVLVNGDNPISFLSVQETNIAYGSHPLWILEDDKGKILQKQNFDVEILLGSFPFYATLSKDGGVLAMSREEGKIELIDSRSGELKNTIQNNFRTVRQMEFVSNDKILVVQETHGKWKIRFFDVDTCQEIDFSGLDIPGFSKDSDNFCFNADESLMIKQQGWWIYVFDFIDKKFLYEFKLEHCVRRAGVKFIDNDTLGARTDYGCFSLYKIRTNVK